MTRRNRRLRDPTAAQAYPEELLTVLSAVLETVGEREKLVLAARFGFFGEAATLAETAQLLGLTTQQVMRIESAVKCKLRHPSRAAALRAGLGDEPGRVPSQVRQAILAALTTTASGEMLLPRRERAHCSAHGWTAGGSHSRRCAECPCLLPPPGDSGGRPRTFCSDGCKQMAYRGRRRAADHAGRDGEPVEAGRLDG